MAEIALTRGLVALVDDEDIDWLNQWRWYARPGHAGVFYALRWSQRGSADIRMHRALVDAPPGVLVDHINGDGLDNRRCNLRLASACENQRNTLMRARGASGFIGVSLDRRRAKYRAHVKVHGKTIWKNGFDTPLSAALARDALARQHHGQFAVLNFPEAA